jgi:phosphocarrier protein HPr
VSQEIQRRGNTASRGIQRRGEYSVAGNAASRGMQRRNPARSASTAKTQVTPCSRVGLATALPGPALVTRRMAAMADTTTTKTVTVSNRQGIHARPAHAIATLASRFKANIEIVHDSTVADGKSILAIMTLAAGQGTLLLLRASGEDAAAAIHAVEQLIASGFGEDDNPHEAASEAATD